MQHSQPAVPESLSDISHERHPLEPWDRDLGVLFDQAPVAMVLLDSHGTITKFNTAYTNLFTQWAGPFVHQSLSLFVAPVDRERLARACTEVARGHQDHVQIDNVRLVIGGLSKRRFSIRLLRVCNTTGIVVLVGHIFNSQAWTNERDAPHLKRLEAMGSLTASLAHDFKNLVTAVLQGCELLLARHEPQTADYDDIVYMRAAAERAKDLAQQTLFLAKGVGRTPSLIDADQAIADLAPMLDRLLGDTITLILEPKCSGARVHIESSQFTQIILNLVTNARDAMPDGGRLMIRTAIEENGSMLGHADTHTEGARHVAIYVTDTGKGISPTISGRVFEPFFTTKAQQGGTGLGLSTVRRIIEEAGGTVQLASSKGEGTTVCVRLPELTHAEHSGASGDARQTGACHGEAALVLLVEDEDAVRRFASRTLRSNGYQVIEVRTAEDGLSQLMRSDITVDLIITDLVLPGVNGDEFCRRALELDGSLAIILVSGYGNAGELAATINSSCLIPLSKPYSLSDLVGAAEQLISRRERLRASHEMAQPV
ncbi:MAG: response regulator [Hyphomicrobiales bacterium]|nr:response regulator [Hyphomicrobiales bacterium]